ncbi:hypothetical protein M2336_003585 [Sphingobium sp. B1D7B]|uniref:hypothetical protein n=1 Tax=Sphingobium sp. B1D7B TaxID=2940578 RepID=UPI002225144E|nr:hypothetical protein [Sphingobium sp. B1D7B]MCW2406901.1 hypothetical protein [Sphingobium sp. B1D7B]
MIVNQRSAFAQRLGGSMPGSHRHYRRSHDSFPEIIGESTKFERGMSVKQQRMVSQSRICRSEFGFWASTIPTVRSTRFHHVHMN